MTPGSPRWWHELGIEMPQVPAADAVINASGRTGVVVAEKSHLSEFAKSARVPPVTDVTRPSPATRDLAHMDWDALEATIDACRDCALGATRRRSVPGSGDRSARWLLVGEGPGAEEDQRGLPFVGASGALLDSMLSALGLQRERSVYIANVVKCRPPANRTPDTSECAACMPYLERQIALIQPTIIVAFGLVAAQNLLQTKVNVGSLRGKVHDRGGIPLVVTYHPAYLLRNQPEKARAWTDLCLASRTFAGVLAAKGQA